MVCPSHHPHPKNTSNKRLPKKITIYISEPIDISKTLPYVLCGKPYDFFSFGSTMPKTYDYTTRVDYSAGRWSKLISPLVTGNVWWVRNSSSSPPLSLVRYAQCMHIVWYQLHACFRFCFFFCQPRAWPGVSEKNARAASRLSRRLCVFFFDISEVFFFSVTFNFRSVKFFFLFLAFELNWFQCVSS